LQLPSSIFEAIFPIHNQRTILKPVIEKRCEKVDWNLEFYDTVRPIRGFSENSVELPVSTEAQNFFPN
jgi:hypothetical protein